MSSLIRRIGDLNKLLSFVKTHQHITGRRGVSSLNGSNANYIDELYEMWKKDNSCVHASWDLLFKAAEKGLDLSQYYYPPPSIAFGNKFSTSGKVTPTVHGQSSTPAILQQNMNVCGLINSYQTRGHVQAKIDPLNFEFSDISKNLPELTLSHWKLSETEMNQVYILPSTTYIGNGKTEMTLKEIVGRLEEIYTSSIGYEYAHIEDETKVQWLRQRIESTIEPISSEEKRIQLERISRSVLLENFLAKKFPSEKRFGLEGCETMISCLEAIIDKSSVMGVESFVMGMAHRGRLNVLSNVCHQPLEHIFTRFNDELAMEDQGSGDVKYHLGISNLHYNVASGKEIRLSMVANPSHLEAVDPVVKGKTRAEQDLLKDDGTKVQCILIHGDAAFAGQGVVFETINLADLADFSVHGTVHIVANNQIGFTTDPCCSRSSRYCSDVAKIVNAPIFHVNADDPESVLRVSLLAAEYRNTFKSDVFIDIVGYRRNGHNEGDNPSFTQPHMYKAIASRPNIMEMYSKKLIDSNVISKDSFHQIVSEYERYLDAEFQKAQRSSFVLNNIWIDSPWKGFFKQEKSFRTIPTGFSVEQITKFQRMCCEMPKDFKLHPALQRVINGRLQLLDQGKIDWAMAEIAAFSSLLSEGIHVRLSGQDAQRGTFSHRHHVLHDSIKKDNTYTPLNHIDPKQASYVVCNSSLSEYGVLGFEHGYSTVSPHVLCIWEGQFGDFANTAQCIIDQFISSGEDKWIRQSGIVMLLPHGFDGMGPEHSSARLERFLQLAKEDPDVFPDFLEQEFEVKQIYQSNYIVANPTTPANIFHLLRRQLSFNFRKPLIVMSPKNLLRLELAQSPLCDLQTGTSFRRVIPEEGDASKNSNQVKRLIFCTGKIYYELLKTRKDRGLDAQVAISRIEQISPFPFDLVSKEIAKYSNADIMFVQEEPKNQGAYYHVKPMISLASSNTKPVTYCGRPVSASPATGSKYQHNIEQNKLLNDAFVI